MTAEEKAQGADGLVRGGHGGNRLALAARAGRPEADLLDFSVNVRPDGPEPRVQAALLRGLGDAALYPSPHAEEALARAEACFGIPRERLCFGNGSAELIHALCRALRRRGHSLAVVPEPAFSEYEAGCRLAGLAVRRVFARQVQAQDGEIDWELPEAELLASPEGAAVFLANPGNPAGTFLPRERFRALALARPDMVWVLDEAFIRYLGPDSGFSALAWLAGTVPALANIAVLRSLTKFEALAGARIGFMAAAGGLAREVRELLPSWNLNCFAVRAACAVLEEEAMDSAAEEAVRRRCRESLADLKRRLAPLPLAFSRSAANYLLVRLDKPFPDLNDRLLRDFGMSLRACADYPGLGDGRWFRIAVREPEDHSRLAEALSLLLAEPGGAPCARRSRPTPALMIQGTCSNAGKSVLAAAFCRIFREDGFDVCPFKAQNMSLNSGVAPGGGELGRAQILQAQAACLDADVRMNPVLLKPHSDKGSQVILLGRPQGRIGARDFLKAKAALWEPVCQAYRELAAEHEIMVLEGAGSPAEVNLRQGDIVNMAMARHAQASVLLAGDIDRGGVYASFLGTWAAFTQAERRLLKGFVVNRFRGDESLLAPAHDWLFEATGTPVVGVVPFLGDMGLPAEDSLAWDGSIEAPASLPDPLDVLLVLPAHASNCTDFAPLAMEPDVRLRTARRPSEWGSPDLVILPGSKNTAGDLAELRRSGLADLVCAHAAAGGWTAGVCGGMQMLGRSILDPCAVESGAPLEAPGLGVLPVETTLARDKTLRLRGGVATPFGAPASGYEIHHGVTRLAGEGAERAEAFGADGGDGLAGVACGRAWGTYLHGIFDGDAFRRAFLDHVRESLGKKPQGRILAACDAERGIRRLAAAVRAGVDMDAVYAMLGLGRPK